LSINYSEKQDASHATDHSILVLIQSRIWNQEVSIGFLITWQKFEVS